MRIAWSDIQIQSYLHSFSNCPILCRAEIEMYKELEPSTRLLILKAICDIRVEVRANFVSILGRQWSFSKCQSFQMCIAVDNCYTILMLYVPYVFCVAYINPNYDWRFEQSSIMLIQIFRKLISLIDEWNINSATWPIFDLRVGSAWADASMPWQNMKKLVL